MHFQRFTHSIYWEEANLEKGGPEYRRRKVPVAIQSWEQTMNLDCPLLYLLPVWNPIWSYFPGLEYLLTSCMASPDSLHL